MKSNMLKKRQYSKFKLKIKGTRMSKLKVAISFTLIISSSQFTTIFTSEGISMLENVSLKDKLYFVNFIQTEDEGFIISANIKVDDSDEQDFLLVKIDKKGNVLWLKNYGYKGVNILNEMIQTSDKGFILTGSTQGDGIYEMYNTTAETMMTIKVDEKGTVLWVKNEKEIIQATSVLQLNNENFLFLGYTVNGSVLAKTDSNGSILWKKVIYLNNYGNFFDMIQTSDNNFVFTGHTREVNASDPDGLDLLDIDALIVKTNDLGERLWNYSYGGKQFDWSNSVIETSDNGLLIVGYSKSYSDFGDYFIVKTDQFGQLLWNLSLGARDLDECYDVIEMSDKSYIVAGYSINPQENENSYGIVVYKISESGQELDNYTYNRKEYNDYGINIINTKDGGFAIGGKSNEDILIIKSDKGGRIQWQKYYGDSKPSGYQERNIEFSLFNFITDDKHYVETVTVMVMTLIFLTVILKRVKRNKKE